MDNFEMCNVYSSKAEVKHIEKASFETNKKRIVQQP